jgi:hypothetical protein
MSRLGIETADGRSVFEPGAEIDVFLEWDLEDEPEAVELRLVWNTAGKGETDLEVARSERFEWPARNGSRRTTITLPRNPYSFSGKLISLIWALELVAFPGEVSTRKEITIAPGGREVLISGNDEDPPQW